MCHQPLRWAWLGRLPASATWLFWRRRPSAAVPLQPWRPADSLGLAAMLVLTLAIATPPFARVGEADAHRRAPLSRLLHRRLRVAYGARRGALEVHDAAAESLSRVADDPLLLGVLPDAGHGLDAWPPTVARHSALPEGQRARHRVAVACRWCSSPPGLRSDGRSRSQWRSRWHLSRQARRAAMKSTGCGRAASRSRALRDINIDAITAWHFQGLRLDGLPRCLWYVPQHSMSYALGLIAHHRGRRRRERRASACAILLCGVAHRAAPRCSIRSSVALFAAGLGGCDRDRRLASAAAGGGDTQACHRGGPGRARAGLVLRRAHGRRCRGQSGVRLLGSCRRIRPRRC